MALIFMDSCSWDTSDIQYKYYNWNVDVYSADATSRRVGATSIKMNDRLGGLADLTLDLPSVETIIYGSAFYFTGLPTTNYRIMSFSGDANTVEFGIGPNNSLYVSVDGNTYYAPNDTISALAWHFIELKILVHPTAGSIQVRVGETLVINETGLNTGATSTNIDYINWRGIVNNDWYMQDIYVCDGTGGINDDFLGDIKIDIIRPNGSGTYSQFTPSAGSNWENVDEVPIDEDTTYNESTLVGQKDTYNHADISIGSVTIYGIQQFTVARKSDVGQYKAKQLLKSGTTESLGDELLLNDSYTGYRQLFDQNPDTLTAWTETTVNAVESGITTV